MEPLLCTNIHNEDALMVIIWPPNILGIQGFMVALTTSAMTVVGHCKVSQSSRHQKKVCMAWLPMVTGTIVRSLGFCGIHDCLQRYGVCFANHIDHIRMYQWRTRTYCHVFTDQNCQMSWL